MKDTILKTYQGALSVLIGFVALSLVAFAFAFSVYVAGTGDVVSPAEAGRGMIDIIRKAY